MTSRSLKWRPFIASVVIIVGLFSASISNILLFSSNAKAYTYKDDSLTTKEDCEAAGGTWVVPPLWSCNMPTSPEQEAKVIAYRGWLADCFKGHSMGILSSGDIQSYKGFTGGEVRIGHIVSGENGKWRCDDSYNIRRAVEFLGYTSFLDLLKTIGCASEGEGKYNCLNFRDSTSANGIFKKIVDKKYGMGSANLSDPDKYYLALHTFTTGCKADPIASPTEDNWNAADNDSKTYRITYVDNTSGTKTEKVYTAERSRGTNISTVPESIGWDDGAFECGTLASMTKKYADAYASWVKANLAIAKKIPDATSNVGSTTTGSGKTCGDAIQGIGWIICPVLNAVGGANDGIYRLAESMLRINPLEQDSSSTSLYAVWGVIRNIANVVFVILFLVVIFSQLTGAGISNYGIKKMLPRIIIGAIAINLSFLAMQILVDVFNILGKGLYDLINGVAPNFDASANWQNLGSTVAATGLTVAGVAGALFVVDPGVALMIIAPSAIMALFAWLAGFLTLVIRQAAIPILAIVSPLAFLAYIFPNTQSWFKRWWNLLLPMLMLYPLASLVFAGSKFAANIIYNGNKNGLNLLISLVVLALPMFSLPFLARHTGAMLGMINGALTNLADRFRKPIGDEFGAMADERRLEDLNSTPRAGWRGSLQRGRQAISRRRQERGLRTKAQEYQAQQDLNRHIADNQGRLAGQMPAGSAAQRFMQNAATLAEEEEIKNAQVPLQRELAQRQANGEKLGEILKDQATGASRTHAERAAAMRMAAGMGQDGVMRHLQRTVTDPGQKLALQEAINAGAGALKDKAPDIIKGLSGAFDGSITGKDLVGYSSDTVKELMDYAVAQNQAGNDAVLKSINSALTDITSDTGLQTTFTGDSGRVIWDTIQSDPSIAGTLSSAGRISTDDYRIR
ncbi:MAG: hypothetical protein ACM3KH_00375 [Thiobacillus sp.]